MLFILTTFASATLVTLALCVIVLYLAVFWMLPESLQLVSVTSLVPSPCKVLMVLLFLVVTAMGNAPVFQVIPDVIAKLAVLLASSLLVPPAHLVLLNATATHRSVLLLNVAHVVKILKVPVVTNALPDLVVTLCLLWVVLLIVDLYVTVPV